MNARRLAVTALALGLAACSSSSSSPNMSTAPGGPGADAFVTIADYAFSPDTVTIASGKTLEWSNNGPSSHTVTSNTSAWTNTTLAPPSGTDPYGGGGSAGGTFLFTFTSPGTYAYHCSIHAGMNGVVVVTP